MSKSNLVVYHYFEKDASYRNNFLHFLTFGVDLQNDYIMVISGDCTIELPALENIRYIYTESKRSDFGGYAHLLKGGLDIAPYEFVFFINSSVRGPYMLPYAQQPWTEILLEQMKPDVGIVGSSICILNPEFRHSLQYQSRYSGIPPYSHVQTMAYVMRRSVLEKLISEGFYKADRDITKTLAIEDYEIHLSQLVLAQGWNLRCLLPEFNGIDYRLPHVSPNPSSTVGDPNEALGYFGRSIHPYEGLFVKTNRSLYTSQYLMRLAYSMWQVRASSLPTALLSSQSIQDYIDRIKAESLHKSVVEDFSYLPGQQEERALLKVTNEELSRVQGELNEMRQSSSWKITAPLRRFKDWISS